MDDPLHLDGDRCLDRLAWRRWRPTTPANVLCRTAPSERGMVGSILRSPEPRLGSSGNRCLVGSDSGNCRDVPEGLETGKRSYGSLSDLGELRWDSECQDLVAELILEPYSKHRVRKMTQGH